MTEKALRQAQEMLRTLLSNDIRQTEATALLVCSLDQFLEAYGVDGETKLDDLVFPTT